MNLAAYIREDLKHRINCQEDLPCKLTLPGLATYYEVSVTPVRTAVADLIAEGVIRKRSNGRLGVISKRKPRRRAPAKPIKPPRSASEWDQVLVSEVMMASLERDDVFLREEGLAQKYDIGRSVIRQSLGRLAGAGLIEHVPRRGWRVHPIQGEDLCAYLEIREALELKALDLSRPHLVRQDLEQMLEGNPSTSGHESPRLDNRLHSYLIEKSGNRYIQNFFGQYTAAYYTAVFDHAGPETHVVAEMAGQHRQILEALIAKHWARARRALSEHIQAQHPVAMKMVDVLLKKKGP